PLRQSVLSRSVRGGAPQRRSRGGAAFQETRPLSLVGQPESLSAALALEMGSSVSSVLEDEMLISEKEVAQVACQTDFDDVTLAIPSTVSSPETREEPEGFVIGRAGATASHAVAETKISVHPVALQTSQSQVQTSPTPTGAFSRAFSPAPRRTTLTQADLSGLSTGNESSDTTIRNVGVPGALSITDEANENYHDARMSIGMTTPWESREDFHSMLTMSDNDYLESEDDESIKGSRMPSHASPSRPLSTRRKALKRGSRMLRSWKWRSSKKLSSARKIHSVPLSNIRHFRLSQIKRKLFNKQVPNIGVSSSASATFRLAICDYSQFSNTSRMADAQKMNVESPATSQEINHHTASTEAQSTIPTSLVRPQTSVATVPGTPGADSGCSSFVLPSISSASRCKPGSNTIRAQGTPLAVGVVRGWKPNAIPSSLITPSHANPSGLSSSLLKSSMLKTAVSQEDDDAQHAPTSISDADQDGSEQEEARFLLEVARAQRLVRSIEQELAKAKLKENIALGELYKFRAEEAERRLEIVEFELGCMRNSMRNSTVALDDEPSDRKRRRTSLSSVF
ncbi:hypothetical protein EDD15DRAFT_2462778, partial [Pisolithus albus]